MMKKKLVYAGLALLMVFAPGIARSAGPPKTLRICGVRDRDHIYAEISLEFPKKWDIKVYQLRVDGQDVNFRPMSYGFTEDRKTAKLFCFPGAPGVKRISVLATVEGKTVRATKSFKWEGRPFAVLLDYPGDRLLALHKSKLRLVTANVHNVTIKFNGTPIKPEIIGRDPALLTIDPAWRPGLNTVSLEGKGTDGSPVRRTGSFVYPLKGIARGESALLEYGLVKTRSGPFYSVKVEGDAIVPGVGRMVDVWIVDNEGWIGKQTRLVRELKGLKPGRAKILIFEKPNLVQPERLIKEIPLTVAPAGEDGAL